jgi:hypothetical protein
MDLTDLMPSDSYLRRWIGKYLEKKAQNPDIFVMLPEDEVNNLVHQVKVVMPVSENNDFNMRGVSSVRLWRDSVVDVLFWPLHGRRSRV